MADQVRYLLDASAVLAYLLEERGAGYESVAELLAECALLSVNEAETIRRLSRPQAGRLARFSLAEAIARIQNLPVHRVSFASNMAPTTAEVQASGKNISLGDGACVAAARHLDLTILTKDLGMIAVASYWCDAQDVFPLRRNK